MWIVIGSCALVLVILRKETSDVRILAVVIMTLIASGTTWYGVWYSGVTRTEIAPEVDLVEHNQIASYPFTIQKIHNWTSHRFTYQILLGGSDGILLLESAPNDDQSEFMRLELLRSVGAVCGIGIMLVVGTLILIEATLAIRTKISGAPGGI